VTGGFGDQRLLLAEIRFQPKNYPDKRKRALGEQEVRAQQGIVARFLRFLWLRDTKMKQGRVRPGKKNPKLRESLDFDCTCEKHAGQDK